MTEQNAGQMMLAEILALRCVVSALAREVLLRNGSEAFVHAEAQAKHFLETAAVPAIDAATVERAKRAISGVFTMADGTP